MPNLILFSRLLRELGLNVSPSSVIDCISALEYIDIGHKPDFYHTARSLFVHRQEDLLLFDRAFELFWHRLTVGGVNSDKRALELHQSPVTLPSLQNSSSTRTETTSPARDADTPIVEPTLTYSVREVLQHKDFSNLSATELDSVKHLIAQLLWRFGQRRTHRQQPGDGQLPALRRTLRQSLRQGGEILEWSRLQPKSKPRKLVVIADISGSMERYTSLLLHFIFSLTRGVNQPVESFVFSTRLTRITRELQKQDLDRALHEVSLRVSDWSGGTRIGEALKTFNFNWVRRVLGRGAVVLLISDGWDRGEVDLLRSEIARLQRSCHRLIWLNPLLGLSDYEPLTRGMQASLPYIDDFLPIHNLDSLEKLATHLANLSSNCPRHHHLSKKLGKI